MERMHGKRRTGLHLELLVHEQLPQQLQSKHLALLSDWLPLGHIKNVRSIWNYLEGHCPDYSFEISIPNTQGDIFIGSQQG